MSFNEKPGMYVFEKKTFSEQGSEFDDGLVLSQDFLFIVTKKIGILLLKLFWPTVRKNCSSDREKLLEFEAEG